MKENTMKKLKKAQELKQLHAKKSKIKTAPLVIHKAVPCCEPFVVTDKELRSGAPTNNFGGYVSVTKTSEGNTIRCYVAASVME